jgi:hypothetical protein
MVICLTFGCKTLAMKKIPLLFALMLSVFALAQPLRPIASEVNRLHKSGPFTQYALFSARTTIPGKYPATLQKYTSAAASNSVLNAIDSGKPQTMRIGIPFDGQILPVDLYRTEITTPDFKVQTPNGYYNGYQKGNYYRGIIVGDNQSLVAFSFFKDQAIGVVSSAIYGDINIGKLNSAANTDEYIVYSANDILKDISLKCGTVETQPADTAHKVSSLVGPATTSKTVRMYYEIDYLAYISQNSNLTQTLDWATAIHNNVAATYANDGISNLPMSEVFVWTQPGEPYENGTACCGVLYSFAQRRWAFNGDLANLIQGGGGGNGFALAYTYTCQALHGGYTYGGNGPYEISSSDAFFEDFPIFSNTVKVVCHEAGHVLGAHHTHACVWNGNNTQIDDCGNHAGLTEGNCYDPDNEIIPENFSGTIMSYCCCTSMAIGFGPQPRQVIINTIENGTCFGTDGISSCTPSIDKLLVTEVGQTSAKLTIEDLNPNANTWLFRILPNDFQAITTNPMVIEGLSPKQIYSIEVKQICENPYTANYIAATNIYTSGVYCDETIFDYTHEFDQGVWGYETSYFPANPTDKVRVQFNFVRVDPDGDTLYIHNGPTVNDAVIATYTGTNNNPPAVTSTHPTGALTFDFVSDYDLYQSGWTGTVTCIDGALATDDFTAGNAKFYPNPVTDNFYFEANEPIRSIRITDVLGRNIMQKQFGTRSGKMDLSTLSSGNYLAILDYGDKKEAIRIIKN